MANDRETGTTFDPKFDSNGLLCAAVVAEMTREILMVGYMDREALDATLLTGKVHFHSRSRNRLWMKGESSGHYLNVVKILVDCDQDALLIEARPDGPTCHTGAQSCFYRQLVGGELERI